MSNSVSGVVSLHFFFFQAEDGIRDLIVTGVQTCALPIYDLKDLCALTDGNLSRQLQMLKESGMVEIEKGTSGNRPQTICRLTRTGRKRFLEYIAELERVVSNATDVRSDPAAAPENGRGLSM